MTNMAMYSAEFFGTLILILLGDGVVANVSLNKSKGEGGGWIVVTAAWGLAVAIAAYTTGWVSGAHLNPAVTVGMAVAGSISWSLVPGYIISQILGAIVGAFLVYSTFKDHFAATDDPDVKLGVFCTAPAIRNHGRNFITEVIGTAVLVGGIMGINNANNEVGALSALLAGFLVWVIGLSLGGPTGYAINPARDLGPRIAHAILPIPGKRDSDWSYAHIPVIGPIVGGILGALIYMFFSNMWV
ncbi:aquaporin family protein [Anaerosalibacter bizertensis]|uniref:Aquaporin family protein n=2 Tax=Anaerosalibacter bizertensis TaxID=932217 RepID=A0A844FGW6_9FIRM|nr:MIP/aquaporin family protein [Anaerosalibacter bizertensis]HHV26944.1 aquaporin family protein [Tissierellia bacterium]MBU5293813.1 aquaporin family protein [Anaerosalibacter bizertensis]MCB5559220.1 aquaporin family protein [Anaerosalibacter bizertensis]MCG4565383.1 aquaporin family protein [Anaerosalibacter bizertensis]MCG4582974.1 aquaporin family protein [Anaerosalibacter bizertensis]